MPSLILGIGDVLTLIKKAQTQVDEKQAMELQEKMRPMSFTLYDFLEQMGQVKSMGPLEDLMAMIPGANKMKGLKNAQFDQKQVVHVEAIIQSMTKKERGQPDIMKARDRTTVVYGNNAA